MGRLIDADKAISDYAHYGISHSYDVYDLEDILTECPTVAAIPQSEYETRLKADMIAMLTDLQLEIEEQRQDNPEFNIWKDGYNTANDIDCVIIQQKINSLKENTDGNK